MLPWQAVALGYLGLSVAAFLLYGWDKHRARRGGRRVPEARLHALAVLGGFVGAWLGMRAFRHKTQRPLFLLVQLLAAGAHGGAWAWWWFAERMAG